MRWVTPWMFCEEWEVSYKNGKTPVEITVAGEFAGFEYGGRRGVFLNLGLDVEMDGMTCHLSSSFAENTEMGEVTDTAEPERDRRRTV